MVRRRVFEHAPSSAPAVASVPAAAVGSRRNLGLDIARAAAITLVFASHTVVDLFGPVAATLLRWGGKAGVELFFSLSGFLIGQLLIRLAETDSGPRAVGGFLFRRWMRTLPLYYATLWFAGWFFGFQNIHAYLLLQNFYPAEPRALVVSWSLVLEEYFYLFFPLAMLPIAFVVGRGVRMVATTAALLILVCVLGALVNVYRIHPVPMATAVENPFMRMDCAAYGVLMACWVRAFPGATAWMARRSAAIVGASILFVGVWAALYVAISHASGPRLIDWGMMTWGKPYFALELTVQDVAFAWTVAGLFLMRPALPRWLAWCVQQISLMSYSIYLLHTLVMVLVGYYFPALGDGPGKLGIITVLTLGSSALTYRTIERPVLRLRDRMSVGRPRVVSPRSA